MDKKNQIMAPQYKLTYFNGRGFAEVIRFLLSYLEEDFEDVRVEQDDWPALKPSTPFGKVPILEVNGKKLTQSIAIARYLGKKAGLAGKDDFENLQIDIIADTVTDLRIPSSELWYIKDEEVKKAKRETYKNETLPSYLKKLDAVVKENGGYLANKKLSWVDFMFVTLIDLISLSCEVTDVTADYPNLYALREKVNNIPQIKKWIEKRPKSEW